MQRKSRITVCRISLSSIKKVALCDSPKSRKEIAAEIKKEKRSLFDYRIDISPEHYICVFSDEGGELTAIYLAYDEKLFEYISK